MASKKTAHKLLSGQRLVILVVLLITLITSGFYFLSTYIKNTNKDQYSGEYVSEADVVLEEKQIPSEFPKDFPVAPNSALISSWTNTDKNNLGVSVIWTSTETFDSLVSFYKTELEKNGYKVLTEFSNKPSYVISFSKTGMSGYVGIAQSEKNTISVTIGFNK